MNTLELKKVIYSFLTGIHSNVFDSKVPGSVSYPRIVYTLEDSETDQNEKMEIFNLYVDVYDNDMLDGTDIDSLASQIDGDGDIKNATGLHRKHYYSTSIQADFYRYNRDTIEEKGSTIGNVRKNVKHIRLEYDVYAYLA